MEAGSGQLFLGLLDQRRHPHDAQQKLHLDGSLRDLVTSADQQAYLRVIKNGFPDYGVIAEEDGPRVDCKLFGRSH